MTKTQSVSIYLLKKTVLNYEDALDAKKLKELTLYPPSPDFIKEAAAAFYMKTTPTKKNIKWLPFIQEGFAVQPVLPAANVSGVLFMKASGRVFAICFAYGKSFLKEAAVEHDFGLKVALGDIDGEHLKDVEFSTPEANPLQTKKQAGKGVNIGGFGVNDFSDLLKVVSGYSSSKDDGLGSSSVCGKDALKIGLKCSLSELPAKCATAFKIYDEKRYLKKGFEFIDYVRNEKDPTVIATLDGMLVKALISAPDEVSLAPPEITYDTISGYRYTKGGELHSTLEVSEYLSERYGADAEITIDRIKGDKIFICQDGDDDDAWEKWSVYKSAIFEVSLATPDKVEKYLLFEGAWYKVAQDFQNVVEGYYQKRLSTAVEFTPAFVGKGDKENYEPEGRYNKRIAEKSGYVLLDAEKVPSDMGVHEVCDVLAPGDILFHVKRKNDSSSLSHLFRQGDYSALMLASSPKFRANTISKIEELKKGFVVGFTEETSPKKLTVHFIVLTVPFAKSQEMDIPFFSKVSFMSAARSIESKGYTVKVSHVEQEVKEKLLQAPSAIAKKAAI